MKSVCILALGAMFAVGGAFADEAVPKGKDRVADKPPPAKMEAFKPEVQTSEGSVTVSGSRIEYQAVVGTLVVHPKGWDDATKTADKVRVGKTSRIGTGRTARPAIRTRRPKRQCSMSPISGRAPRQRRGQ